MRSAADIGFVWCSDGFYWARSGLPLLPMVAGPLQHFRSAFFDAWRHSNSADPLLDYVGSMQLLDSSHVRARDKAVL